MSPVVRVLHASVDETVEIHWRRRIQPGSGSGSEKWLDDILIERYTAPPPSTWDARTKESKDPA